MRRGHRAADDHYESIAPTCGLQDTGEMQLGKQRDADPLIRFEDAAKEAIRCVCVCLRACARVRKLCCKATQAAAHRGFSVGRKRARMLGSSQVVVVGVPGIIVACSSSR